MKHKRQPLRTAALLCALVLLCGAVQAPLTALGSAFKTAVAAFTFQGMSIPAYDGDIFEEINGDVPRFSDEERTQDAYEVYAPLDALGRVGVCSANIDKSLMPTEKRGDISKIYPTGWVQKKYDFVQQQYLYNRCHLIGFQLTGENANRRNLMTGTRAFNYNGMLPFENEVAEYVKQSPQNNVLYRVTPVFDGDNLLAYGVIMEALSVDDNGAALQFCVFVYNVQEGVGLDYRTGDNALSGKAIDISGAYITLAKKRYIYSGGACKPGVKVKNNYVLLPADAYTVQYSGNTAVGTATVTVKGKNGYTGKKVMTFRIVPRSTSISKLTPAKKAVVLKWKKQRVQTSGYQVQYALSSGMKNASVLTIKNNATVQKTVTRLKAKKKYYFRIRTFKTVNGKRYYSNWSGVKSVKTK